MEIKEERINKPSSYYRHYFGQIEEKRNKTVMFYYFTKEVAENFWGEDWKMRERFPKDGGNDFFQIMINLETRDCAYFSVNGEA